ncbi:MAG: hypothetical protein M1832_001358 [Thelocarpon impressellum]|nr:MAG: hypothetical protein M1832_001358 [Thelocarpon impressellum]
MAATSSHGGTPALTPPGSSLSHASAHSPASVSTNRGMSPLSRSAAAAYPSLPAAGGGGGGGGEPSESLGAVFDDDERHRYSTGMLQKASRPAGDGDADGSSGHGGNHSPDKPQPLHLSAALIDPALEDMTAALASPDGDTLAERAQETWVENIRVIESLRGFIAARLEGGAYESEDEDGMAVDTPRGRTEEDEDAAGLYPVLRAVEAAS